MPTRQERAAYVTHSTREVQVRDKHGNCISALSANGEILSASLNGGNVSAQLKTGRTHLWTIKGDSVSNHSTR